MQEKQKKTTKSFLILVVCTLILPFIINTKATDGGVSIMTNADLNAAGPQIGVFSGANNATVNIFSTSTSTSAYTYVTASSQTSGIVPVLETANGRYRIAISGYIGWVDRSALSLLPYKNAKSMNHYMINDDNELIHRITTNPNSTNTSGIVQGKAPSYLSKGRQYLSFDGHYFYHNTESGLQTLIEDYRNGVRTRSINPNEPYYNYFQWLPARAQTKLTNADFRRYLNNNSSANTPLKSRLYEMESVFLDTGNAFGVNPTLVFATAVHESGYGTSYLSKARNNFFGHAAYDSSPGSANTYQTPEFGIRYHEARFMNWNYLDGTSGNVLYYGGFVGNKSLGMNVKYASDPYWGEKIAAHYYNIDKAAGSKDYDRYTIGIVKSNSEHIRKQPNGAHIYTYKHAGVPIAILSDKSTSGWHAFTSEHLLDSNKNLLQYKRGFYEDRFNINNSTVFINANAVDVVRTGKDSTLLTQLNPTLNEFADIESSPITVYALSNATLRPEWSTKYSSILSIPRNTKMTGLKTSNGWLQVVYNDYLGYVNLNNVSLTQGGKPIGGGEETPDPNPEPELPELGNKVYYTTHNLNLREAPVNGKIITEIPYDSKVTGGEPLNGWVKVKYGNHTGYVSVDFLTTTNPNEPETPPLSGDLNNDDKIDIRDMMIIRRHILNLEPLTGSRFKEADLNNDNKLDIRDMMVIRRHILGIETLD